MSTFKPTKSLDAIAIRSFSLFNSARIFIFYFIKNNDFSYNITALLTILACQKIKNLDYSKSTAYLHVKKDRANWMQKKKILSSDFRFFVGFCRILISRLIKQIYTWVDNFQKKKTFKFFLFRNLRKKNWHFHAQINISTMF